MILQSQKLINTTKNVVLANEVELASTMWSRMKGLLGRASLPFETVLWIKSCSSIHTWFMKFSIDAVFVDKKLVVQAVHFNLKPWRLTLPHLRAKDVFEFAGGRLSAKQISVGDQLHVGH